MPGYSMSIIYDARRDEASWLLKMWVLLLTDFFLTKTKRWKYINLPCCTVAWLLVCLRKGHLSWFGVLNAVHVFDQVFEAYVWDLTAYSFHVDCVFLMMGFSFICMWAYVSREIAVTLALLVLEKNQQKGTAEVHVTKLLYCPSAHPAHLSAEIENHFLNHL